MINALDFARAFIFGGFVVSHLAVCVLTVELACAGICRLLRLLPDGGESMNLKIELTEDEHQRQPCGSDQLA